MEPRRLTRDTGKGALTKKRGLLVCAGVAIASSLLFWVVEGHDIQYDVYSESNGVSTYWYSEPFDREWRVPITIMVGLFAGGIVRLGLGVRRAILCAFAEARASGRSGDARMDIDKGAG